MFFCPCLCPQLMEYSDDDVVEEDTVMTSSPITLDTKGLSEYHLVLNICLCSFDLTSIHNHIQLSLWQLISLWRKLGVPTLSWLGIMNSHKASMMCISL